MRLIRPGINEPNKFVMEGTKGEEEGDEEKGQEGEKEDEEDFIL